MAGQRAKPRTLCGARDRGARIVLAVLCLLACRPPVAFAVPPVVAPPVGSPPVASPVMLPLQARQQPARRPLAIVDLVGTAESQALANQVAAALVGNNQLAPITDATIAAALVGPLEDGEDAPLATATRALVDAEESLAKFATSAAIAQATSAMAELERADPTPPHLTVYAALAFLCGRAALTEKNPTQANRWFTLTARLAPTFSPDRGRYVSSVVAAFESARQPLGVTAPLTVGGDGEVVVDGVVHGPAPMTVPIEPGPHLVHLVSPEHAPVGAQIEVLTPGATLQLTALLAPAPIVVARLRRVLQTAPDATARGAAITKMAKLAGVRDALLISRSSDGELELGTWRDQAPGFAKPEAASQTSAEKIFTRIAPPPVDIGPGPGPGPFGPLPPTRPPSHWYEKRWVQASLVGGLLLSAVGVAVALTQDPARRDVSDPKFIEP